MGVQDRNEDGDNQDQPADRDRAYQCGEECQQPCQEGAFWLLPGATGGLAQQAGERRARRRDERRRPPGGAHGSQQQGERQGRCKGCDPANNDEQPHEYAEGAVQGRQHT